MKILRIAFTGAESTGKTTLVNAIKDKFPDVPVITNLTRSVSDYLEKRDDIQENIMATYVEELMGYKDIGFLCDRTLFDVCAYSKVKGVWSDRRINSVLKMYTSTSIYPDYLFYTPIEFGMVQDGGRPEGTRESIDAAIRFFLDTHAANEYITLTGGVEERVKQILTAIA